jgi:tyrosinase
VFNDVEGFGGNGDSSTPPSVGDGHCVTDGPFADLELQYYDRRHQVHCLSRGFLTEDLVSRYTSNAINASVMSGLLGETDYYSFTLNLEEGPHAAIPSTILGDFSTFTAPNGKKPFRILGMC